MPVEKTNPTAELMQAMREYHEATGQRVIFAWTMMAGVNTRDEDAQRLAELTRRTADQARFDRPDPDLDAA